MPAPSAPLGTSALPSSDRAAAAVATIESAGVPLRYAFLPDFSAARPNPGSGGLVAPTYAVAPAPIGVADYGIANRSGALVADNLTTARLEGTFAPTSLSGLALGTGAPDYYGIQLNAVLQNVSLLGNSSYSFWTQNVAEYSTSSGQLTLIDNIWNFSSPQGALSYNAILSHGRNGSQVGTTYYYAVGPTISVGYPFTLRLFLNASVEDRLATVYFNYTLANATVARAGSFDEVQFDSTPPLPSAPVTAPVYRADGTVPSPLGLPDDFELALGGPGGGSNFDALHASATLALDYWDATRSAFEDVPSAYNVGADTGETAVGASATWSSNGAGALGGGPGPAVFLGVGPSFVGGAWNVSNATEGSALLHLDLAPHNGFLFVGPGAAPPASEYQWLPPDGPYVVPPGAYSIEALASRFDPAAAAVAVPSAGTWRNLTLTSDPSSGVYTPLWAFSSSGVANLSTSCAAGTCTLASDEGGPLGRPADGGPAFPWFGESNDFLFPVFPGIWLAGVRDVRIASPPPFTVVPPPWEAAARAAFGLPASNGLPAYLDTDANISISAATFSTWWFAGGYLGASAADASLVLWNTTESRVENSTFLTGGEGLYLYGGAGNVVTGNSFLTYEPLAANAATIAAAVYGSTGLYEADPGSSDLVYNNAFGTYFTAIEPAIDPYTGGRPLVPFDARWNVTPTAGPNIAGGSVVGGNYWWNYGAAGDPYWIRPYNASGGIALGGDYAPILLAPLWDVTFVEHGLPNGTAWRVGIETSGGYVASTGTGSSIVQTWPSGQYFAEATSANGAFGLATVLFVSVSGSNLTENLTLYRLYSLDFRAAAFPGGSFWTVTVWNPLGSWIDLGNVAGFPSEELPAGTYNFTVSAPPGYVAVPASGIVALYGNVTVQVRFGPAGAPGTLVGTVQPGFGAHLWLAGQPVLLGPGGSFNVSVPAGIYALEATAPGHLPYFNNVSVSAGQTVSLAIALVGVPPGSPPASALYVAVSAAVVLGGVALFLALRGRRRPPTPSSETPPTAVAPPPP